MSLDLVPPSWTDWILPAVAAFLWLRLLWWLIVGWWNQRLTEGRVNCVMRCVIGISSGAVAFAVVMGLQIIASRSFTRIELQDTSITLFYPWPKKAIRVETSAIRTFEVQTRRRRVPYRILVGTTNTVVDSYWFNDSDGSKRARAGSIAAKLRESKK